LAEDSAGESVASSAAVAPKPAVKGDRYTPAAKRENHRHTTDFIPRHWAKLGVGYIASLAAVAGLLFGFVKWCCEQNSEQSNSLGLAPLFDAANGGSLAGWLSSLLFGFSAAGSVLVYSIRRHKLDDYRGRYRLWLWSAAAWLVMSIDATANLHTPFSSAMVRMTGWSMLPGGAMWWIGIWGGIVAILALRLLLEVRQCRTATLGFTLVFSLWAAALATDYGWLHLSQSPEMNAAVVAIAGRLIGQVTLFFTIAFYARHVLLDSEGLITLRPVRPKREKPAKKTKAVTEDKPAGTAERLKSSRLDAAHKSVPSPAAAALGGAGQRSGTSSTGSQTANTAAGYASSKNYSAADDADDRDNNNRYSKNRGSQNRFDDEDEEDGDGDGDSYDSGSRKLSKAERKRLRKQMRRQQRDDEE
jgi:hypothetical protein